MVRGGLNTRIGFQAPRHVAIVRDDAINTEQPDGVQSPNAHDAAELTDVPAIIAEAREFFPDAVGESLLNMMIGRLATLLSQERKR